MIGSFAGEGVHVGLAFFPPEGDFLVGLGGVENERIIIGSDKDAIKVSDVGMVTDVGHGDWLVVFGAIGFDETDEVLFGINRGEVGNHVFAGNVTDDSEGGIGEFVFGITKFAVHATTTIGAVKNAILVENEDGFFEVDDKLGVFGIVEMGVLLAFAVVVTSEDDGVATYGEGGTW